MRVDLLDYSLPPELIAQRPLAERGAARMLVVPRTGPPRHQNVADLARCIPAGSLVVVNDTQVIPARILGRKNTGGKAEIFLVERTGEVVSDGVVIEDEWSALGKASKGLPDGTIVTAGNVELRVHARRDDGLWIVRARTTDGSPLREALDRVGAMPIPPYMKRDADADDGERYQTIFARHRGALAAPTAGLHLTHELVAQLRARDVAVATTTLHVGLGTFRPVVADDLDDHDMHPEWYSVPEETAVAIADARRRDRPVVAVGTTVVRALETCTDSDRPGHVRPASGETRLLLQPGSPVRIVDLLLTNFHLPRSTLLALVGAFAGLDRVLAAYGEAIANEYRFYSYGDAMMVERHDSPYSCVTELL